MGGAWDGVGEPSCLLQAPYSNFCTWGLPPHPPQSQLKTGLCSQFPAEDEQTGGWLAGWPFREERKPDVSLPG